ncbi:MAG: NADH-quinone oxidoreductase subunit C [Clostridia bacterium]|nr:NADH-quinone oxidoreductase subunit C [Clostridia bacterium]
MADFRDKVVEELQKKFADKVEAFEDNTNESILVQPVALVDVMKELRDKFELPLLMLLTGVEYPEEFLAVYQVTSASNTNRVNVKVKLPKHKPEVPSIVSVYPAANVQERETWDLMGITYKGHPNLVRILCPDDFEGHPLRKDFKG